MYAALFFKMSVFSVSDSIIGVVHLLPLEDEATAGRMDHALMLA